MEQELHNFGNISHSKKFTLFPESDEEPQKMQVTREDKLAVP